MTAPHDPTTLPDLAARPHGGTVMAASDEFFADKENLIKPEAPTYQPHTFTPKGQQYDGWETRRRFGRRGGHDWVLVRLGAPGVVRAIDVDTAFFLGNYPEQCRIEGTGVEGYPGPEELERADWFELVPASPLKGGEHNVFAVHAERRVTHVRLHALPDGGIARLRVHGEVVPDPRDLDAVPFDLVSTLHGGRVVECSDSFFSPPANMLQPGESRFMADGWETGRRRDDGHDWAVVELACEATPLVAEIATTHYRGNSPDRVSLSGSAGGEWFPLLPETKLQADTTHRFRLGAPRPVTRVRIAIHPDGGVGRFRLYGQPTEAAREALARRWFTLLPESQALAVLAGAGVGGAEAGRLVADREHVPLGVLLGKG
ncbi:MULTISPECIES: allantoicase [Amycolatopsis]|uniref:allantoicase n=1 Tax=Amycolatopsis TaxID=1813 RepID=UPI000B8A86E9|nr:MULTISPECIES: allantoicase [Amycolatopsis]OXM75073.1 allantoicase [Amycolatopsis sp. KNN50.9b]